MNLALFDLDNTLLAGDSDFEWAQFLIGKGVLDREVHEAKNHRVLRAVQGRHARHPRIPRLPAGAAGAPPARRTRRLARASSWQRRIRPLIGEPARALVRSHLAAGDLCAIVTATNSFVTGPIAREFGIPHLIATDPAATRKTAASPAVRAARRRSAKARSPASRAWLESLGLWWGSFADSCFYSDSHNDLPLLARVRTPVAVDPDATLRRHSAGMGWPIITLR